MSIKIVEEQIKKFLSDDTPEVLAICGKWGVGKTHFWNATVKKLAASEKTFKLPRYGYISLFGINSLQSLKSELFTALVDRNLAGKDLGEAETLKQNKLSALKMGGARLAGMFGPKLADLLLRNSSSIAESVCFASVRNSVICFDDLERIGKGLEGKAVLGLASLLKEQKKCKVVFLLNDEKDTLGDFRTYHEKVVDLNLRFEPTARECAEIALKGDSEEMNILRDCVCKLNLTNIRTIKKIERVVNLVIPLLAKYEREITRQAIESITIFGWSHYRAGDSEIPPIEHIESLGYALLGFGEDDAENEIENEEKEKRKRWNSRLQEYGYKITDELDRSLMKGITNGYFVETELYKAAAEKNAEVVAYRSAGSHSEAWNIYHETFADNQDEVVDTLFQSFRNNAKYISPINMNGLVTMFRELGEDEKADAVIELYIDIREPTSEVFDLSSYSFAGDVSDEKARERFNEVHASVRTEESLVEVIQRISERDGWSEADMKFLEGQGVDDFLQVFTRVVGPQLPKYVARCLQFGRYVNSTEQQKKIAKNASEALRRLATDSKINQLRIKKYGVSIDDSSS